MSVQDDVLRIAVAAEQLLREAKRVSADVAAIKRIFAKLEALPEPQVDWAGFPNPEIKLARRRTVIDSLNMIAAARKMMEFMQDDLRIIDAALRDIAVDAHSREEMKPYLKE